MNPDFELAPDEILRVLMAAISPPDPRADLRETAVVAAIPAVGMVTQAVGEALAKSNSRAASV